MKTVMKTSLKVVTLLLSGLLSACGTFDSKDIIDDTIGNNLEDELSVVSIDKEQFDFLDFRVDSDILLFCNENIYYSIVDPLSSNPEEPYKTLYVYNVNERSDSEIFRFKDSRYSSGDALAVYEDRLYLVCDTDEGSKVLNEIDLKTYRSHTIKEWQENTLFSGVYKIGDQIVLCNINIWEDETEYTITLIDSISLKETDVLRARADFQSGVIVKCISVDADYIYAFKETYFSDNSNTNHSISVYDSAGNNIRNISVDLNAFLDKSDELKMVDRDSIFDLYKEGEYFIFGSLNGRINIQSFNEKNETEQLEIPEPLYINLPGGYNFLKSPSIDNAYSYIVNPFTGENTMYIFDNSTANFKSISLPYDINHLNRYYRNERGDLLIEETDMGSFKKEYFILKHEYLI